MKRSYLWVGVFAKRQFPNDGVRRVEGKHCISRWDGLLWAVSSGFTVFAKSAFVVFGALQVNLSCISRKPTSSMHKQQRCVPFFVCFKAPFKASFFFLIQFNVPFKIISLISRQPIGRWGETGVPRENHLTHPQTELGLSHMWPVRGSNLHQTQGQFVTHLVEEKKKK